MYRFRPFSCSVVLVPGGCCWDLLSLITPFKRYCACCEIGRNSAAELAQLCDETILPPPELFDTARCCSSLDNDQTMYLLPPPAEFDNVSRASSTADLPLPPPSAFYDHVDGLSSSADSRLLCSKSVDTCQRRAAAQRDSGDVSVYNGVDYGDDDRITEAPEDALNSGRCARLWNGVHHPSGAEIMLTADSDEKLLVPVSTPYSSVAVNCPQQARVVAMNVMDKLDELCRSQGPPVYSGPPSSAAVSIPVLHETTSRTATGTGTGGNRVEQRRSIGQSWSDGLFICDIDAGSSLSDKTSKRHSAGASMADVVVSSSAALGARPKVPLLKSRSAFDGLDWKRRPGILRAQSAGVVSPHHQQMTSRRLMSRYVPDGREFSVHSETRRVQVTEDLRHRSLEPDDIQSRTATSTSNSRIASVLSDSSLPSTMTELSSSVGETRRFFSQQSLTSGHKNLLEQASERRKATRLTPKLGLRGSSSTETSEVPESQAFDSDVSHLVGEEQTPGGRPVRGLDELSSNIVESVTSQCLPLTSAERSMETIRVSRPPSLVVRTSSSEVGSPARRVLVAQSLSLSDNNVQSTASDVEPRQLPPRHAPLCSPETSFDTTSEAASGRASPATTSVSTFQGNFSELTVSAGDEAIADSSTTSTTAAERHFIVVAIDFGTTYSGYAFSFVRDPDSVHMMRRWEGGDPGVVNQKTPTTLLLDPTGKFHSFGYAARDSYHDLDTQEAKKWLYFDKFKMVLHHNAVSIKYLS